MQNVLSDRNKHKKEGQDTHAETNEAEQDTVHSYFLDKKLTKGKKIK